MTSRRLRVAIIGLRHLHPRLYMPHFSGSGLTDVIAVVEKDHALRNQFSGEFGVKAYASIDDLLQADKPDIAAIFLPHDECPDTAIALARQGVHLMVEKPTATHAEGAARIRIAAQEAGVLFTTGYCWRFHPVARECKRLIESGILGTVVGGEGRCAAGRVERYLKGNSAWMLQKRHSGGGPLFNLGVHWIDLFRWMLGDEPTEASGQNVKVNKQYDIEDNSFAHIRFSKGAVVALDISYTVPNAYPYSRDLYISVRGTKGCLSWAPAFEGERDVLLVCSDAPEFAGSPLRKVEFELDRTPGYGGIMGMTYVRRFAEAVLKKKQPDISGDDAVAALRVVEAIYKSAKSGRIARIEG